MKACHVCKAECEDFAELCPVCGADLVRDEEEVAENAVEAVALDEIKNPVLVATIEDVVSAEIFGDILTDNGILFSSNSEEEGGGMRVVFGGGFASTDIYVDNDNFEKAKQLYDEFLESEVEFDGDFFFDDETESNEEL